MYGETIDDEELRGRILDGTVPLVDSIFRRMNYRYEYGCLLILSLFLQIFMLSLNEREVLSGMQYYRMDLPNSNHITSPISYYDIELARFGCIGYHARSKGITGEHIFLHMKHLGTPRGVLNILWFYAFLKNMEIRNNSALPGEFLPPPGDPSPLPGEM